MRIYQADISHIRTLAELAVLLWPEHTREELEEQGIKPNTIRLSVGIEKAEDLIAALDAAFAAV